MAPKPFKPPRPRVSSLPTAAPKKASAGRSKRGKGKSIRSKVDEGENDNNSSCSVIIRTPANKRSKVDRTGSASTIRLPSLSPGTSDDEGEKDEEEEEEENEEEQEDITQMQNLETDDLVDDESDDSIDDFLNDSDDSNETSDPFGSNPNTLRRRRGDRSRRRADDNDDSNRKQGMNSKSENMFIPRDLVSVLLNEIFKQGASAVLTKTSTTNTNESLEEEGRGSKRKISEKGQVRMTKQAVGAVCKYLDTFAREAIARAAWESVERGGTGMLEVEDLERLAPQLVLDF